MAGPHHVLQQHVVEQRQLQHLWGQVPGHVDKHEDQGEEGEAAQVGGSGRPHPAAPVFGAGTASLQTLARRSEPGTAARQVPELGPPSAPGGLAPAAPAVQVGGGAGAPRLRTFARLQEPPGGDRLRGLSKNNAPRSIVSGVLVVISQGEGAGGFVSSQLREIYILSLSLYNFPLN